MRALADARAWAWVGLDLPTCEMVTSPLFSSLRPTCGMVTQTRKAMQTRWITLAARMLGSRLVKGETSNATMEEEPR